MSSTLDIAHTGTCGIRLQGKLDGLFVFFLNVVSAD